MCAYHMNTELRQLLHRAVQDEGWPAEEKMRCHGAIDQLRDGDQVPYEVSDQFPAVEDDEDVDWPLPIVASLIEYLGVEHVATFRCNHDRSDV